MFPFLVFGLAVMAVVSCKPRTFNNSEVAERDSSADIMAEPFGVRVNLTTNMATFFENGKPIRKWKVATARNEPESNTPPGKFRFHELTTCVRWVFTRPPFPSAGPCAADNPLGFRAMWFHTGAYGLHGVDDAHVESVTASTAEERRKSSGCVRNHPNDIKWLTDKVASLYGTTPEQLAADVAKKSEKSYRPVGKGLALEVGRWPTDPDIPISGGSGDEVSSGCTVANASGLLSGATEMSVFSTDGKVIGQAKRFEPVCPTTNVMNGKTQVFFPMEPSGLGWVDSKVVRLNCKGNQKWPSLSVCLEATKASGHEAQCESLCALTAMPPPPPPVVVEPKPAACTAPKLDALKQTGKTVVFVHGQGGKYKPRAAADATSPRKDGLAYKLGLAHSDGDSSNLAFDTPDNGQTLRGFRYNMSWDATKTKKIEFTAKWSCDRWVGLLGTESATLSIP